MWKLTSVYIFKLDISHYVLIGAAEVIDISTVTLVFAALFLLVLYFLRVYRDQWSATGLLFIYSDFTDFFLLKWIENKACDLLWTYGPKRKWGFDLKVSFKQQFPVYRGLWDISIFFCVVVYSGCTISLDGSCYIPIRILNKETRISSVALWRANQVLFYIYPITTVFQCFFCWNSAKWDMWF